MRHDELHCLLPIGIWPKKCIISVKCVTSTTLGDTQRMLGLLRGAPGVVSYFRRKTARCVSRNGPKSDRCHLGDESPNLSGIGLRFVSCNRPLDTDQTSTEQTCGRTDQNGKKYAQHHIQGQKDQHLGQGEDKSHRYNQQCEKNEMVLGRAYQPPQRRPMDHACYHLETIKNIMTRKDDKGDQPSGGETTWTNSK